jgi:p-hydroxybenzoate 3-monooxygenase
VNQHDTVVCVVGAGPAGLVLAHLLQQAGVACVVLERRRLDEMRAHPRAGLIEYRTVALLREHGLADPILQQGSENHRCEFRAGGLGMIVDYGALTGGRAHHVYPQHELVGDLADMLLAAGGEVCFGTVANHIDQTDSRAVVHAVDGRTGAPVAVKCDAVAGCDGSRSVVADELRDLALLGRAYPFRWLAVIASAPPSAPHTVYAAHAHGFAGQMRRGSQLTRYYLEIAPDETPEQWPAERVWPELAERLRADRQPDPEAALLLERSMLDLKVRIREPMQSGRVFLAGDAAHLLAPAGGKGMNLAIQDAVELGLALSERYGPSRDPNRLARYSQTRLPDVWRTHEFSDWMLSLLHAAPSAANSRANPAPGDRSLFAQRLRQARVSRLIEDQQYARWFAHAYAGADQAHLPVHEQSAGTS